MTDQKQQETNNAPTDRFQEEFNALPLDKKFANLLQMEVATLTETFDYVAKSSMKVIEKVGDAITDFGTKVEAEAKKAVSSAKSAASSTPPKASTAKPKASAARKPPTGRTPKS
ncbi:MAG: hypothetical protein ABIO36_07465 [Pyrinomonadaceae bacterium]